MTVRVFVVDDHELFRSGVRSELRDGFEIVGDAGTVDDGTFETDFANVDLLASWILRQNGRAVPLEPVFHLP